MATILVIDNRPAYREFLVTLLGYGGHRLLEAADGTEGLAAARAERPDLIITAIVMPAMDGYEFARQIRADPVIGATQIIFHASSHVIAETRRLAEACGVAYVLPRPAEPETILTMVSAALDSRKIPPVRPVPDGFHLRQMRLIANALKNTVEALEAELAECDQVKEQLAAAYLVIQTNASIPRSQGTQWLNDYLARVTTGTLPGHELLSRREAEVLSLVAKGNTNIEIAERLAVSVRTIERHRSAILKKLGLRNRAELVSYAVRQDLLSSGTPNKRQVRRHPMSSTP